MGLIEDHKAKWEKHKAKGHKSKIAQQPFDIEQVPTGATDDYKVMRAAAKMDYEQLKSIPNHAERDKKKPALLKKYRNWLTDWMKASNDHQNDVLFLNMIWAADCGDYDWAIELTDYAVKTGQTMQMIRWNRDAATSTADTVFIASEAQYKRDKTLPDAFETVFAKIIAKSWQVQHILKARYYKLAGIREMDGENWKGAHEFLTTADQLYENVGVKGRIKSVATKL